MANLIKIKSNLWVRNKPVCYVWWLYQWLTLLVIHVVRAEAKYSRFRVRYEVLSSNMGLVCGSGGVVGHMTLIMLVLVGFSVTGFRCPFKPDSTCKLHQEINKINTQVLLAVGPKY